MSTVSEKLKASTNLPVTVKPPEAPAPPTSWPSSRLLSSFYSTSDHGHTAPSASDRDRWRPQIHGKQVRKLPPQHRAPRGTPYPRRKSPATRTRNGRVVMDASRHTRRPSSQEEKITELGYISVIPVSALSWMLAFLRPLRETVCLAPLRYVLFMGWLYKCKKITNVWNFWLGCLRRNIFLQLFRFKTCVTLQCATL